MSDYAIWYRDRKGRESLLPERYPSLEACHAKIRRLASAWQREASIIQHHPGLSFAWFVDGSYIEAWRAGQSEVNETSNMEQSS